MSDTRVSTRPYIIGPSRTDFVVPAGSTFLGTADFKTGGVRHYGLDAPTAAIAAMGLKAIRIMDTSDANGTDININPATGLINLTAVAAWVSSFGTTIVIDKIYDQIGTLHMDVHGANATCPRLELNVNGAKPAIRFTAANNQQITTTSNEGSATDCAIIAVGKIVIAASQWILVNGVPGGASCGILIQATSIIGESNDFTVQLTDSTTTATVWNVMQFSNRPFTGPANSSRFKVNNNTVITGGGIGTGANPNGLWKISTTSDGQNQLDGYYTTGTVFDSIETATEENNIYTNCKTNWNTV